VNERFKALVRSQVGERYYPFFEVSKMVGLSQKVVSRLTSKVMAIDGDHAGKVNIGLSVKFEAKAQKVIGYSRKIGRHWEFSRSTVDLIREYKVRLTSRCLQRFLTPARVGKIPGSHEAP